MLHRHIPPPLWLLLFAGSMWCVSLLMPTVALPSALRLGLVTLFLITAMVIGGSAILAFKRHSTTLNPTHPEQAHGLVTNGIFFCFSRNPMYLANVLILTAEVIYLQSPLLFIFVAAFIWIIQRVQIAPEERALLILFDKQYRAYCAHTRRWL